MLMGRDDRHYMTGPQLCASAVHIRESGHQPICGLKWVWVRLYLLNPMMYENFMFTEKFVSQPK